MFNFGPTFIWVIVNLVFLYIVLKRLLFVPVTVFIDKRTQLIKDSIQNADILKAEAVSLKQKYEEQMLTAKKDGQDILNNAISKANKQSEEIILKAKKDAEDIIRMAKEEIERERNKVDKEIKNQVASLAIAAASKVIGANMNTENNKVLINKFLDEEGTA